MAMLGSVNTANPQEVVKNINVLREQEKRFQAASKEYLKARSVHQAEELAKEMLAKAKAEAETVRQESVALRNEAKALLVEAQKDRDLAASKLSNLELRESQLSDRETTVTFRDSELDRREGDIFIAVSKAEAKESQYTDKLSKIDQALTGLLNG